MEMPPDTLAAFGVNEVVATVEPSAPKYNLSSVGNLPRPLSNDQFFS
jgi:hypothetical protein